MATMMQIETNNDAGKGNASMKETTMGDEGKIIIRNSNNDENDDMKSIIIDRSTSSLSSSSPSSSRQSKQQQPAVSFSAEVNASKMQASFAERTAAEMEEIMNWYSKYDGDEKSSTKTVDQSQSMPNNAMVYDDIILPEEEEEVESFDYKGNDNNDNICHLEQEQLECKIDDCDSVPVVDYFSPANRNKTSSSTTTPSSSFTKKSSPAEIADAADALIRNTQNMADIVAAFHIAEEDQEQGSSESPVRSNSIGGSTDEQAQNQIEIADNLIQSPSSPTTTTTSTTNELQDQQQEIILASLTSPLSPVLRSNSCSSTEQVQNQIDAADDLIRNTQNMAEITAGYLQQQSPSSSSNDGGIIDNKSIGTEDNSPDSTLLETNNRSITNDDDIFDNDADTKLDDDLYATVKFSSSPQVEGNLDTTSTPTPPTSYVDTKCDQYSVIIGGSITKNTTRKPTVIGEVKKQQQQLAKRSKAKKKKKNNLLRRVFQMKFFHYYANTIVFWVVLPLLLSMLIGWMWKSSGTQLLLLQFATTIVQLSLLFITTLLLVSMI